MPGKNWSCLGTKAGSKWIAMMRVELPVPLWSSLIVLACTCLCCPGESPFAQARAEPAARLQRGVLLITIDDSEVPEALFSQLNFLIDGDRVPSTEMTISPERREVLIMEVPSGECHLVITHPEILKEDIRATVKPRQQTIVSVKLRSALVRLRIRSEPGTKIYLDDKLQTEVSEAGVSGIVQFPSGRATISGVHPYFPQRVFTGEFPAGNHELELKLGERIVFSGEFADSFAEGLGFWKAPETWRVKDRVLAVAGPGTGVLKDKIYRNFSARFFLRLTNQRGAVWVVRAREKGNYYLFQLTGRQGNPPNLLRTFVCENGRLEMRRSENVIDDLSKPNDTVEIALQATEDGIRHWIKVSSAPGLGEPEPIGVFLENRFPTGGFGFGTLDSEEFSVYFLNIVPLK
jgi:hypothetical protein